MSKFVIVLEVGPLVEAENESEALDLATDYILPTMSVEAYGHEYKMRIPTCCAEVKHLHSISVRPCDPLPRALELLGVLSKDGIR